MGNLAKYFKHFAPVLLLAEIPHYTLNTFYYIFSPEGSDYTDSSLNLQN